MYTERTERTEQHSPAVHAAPALERSNPQSPKHRIAREIVSNNRRLRQHVGVAAGVCVGITTLIVGFV